MNTAGVVWWKIIIGALLVFIEAKFLLHPNTRTFQPATHAEGSVQLVVEYALLFLGVWLIFSGIRARRKS